MNQQFLTRNQFLPVVALLAVTLLAVGCQKTPSEPVAKERVRVQVNRIVDGDTLVVTEDGKEREVRLHNLEAPELTQPFGIEAATFVADRCEGREVIVEVLERDDQGNISGTVMVDEKNLNLELSKAGFTHLADRVGADEEVMDAIDEAVLAFRGVWKAFADPIEPAEWRKLTAGLTPSSDRPLEGVWEVTAAQWMGNANPGSLGAFYICRGDELIICESPEMVRRTFKLNELANPKEIDYTQEMERGIVKILGIYELEGDQLTLCNSRYDQPRPSIFTSSTTEVGCSLLVLRRVKVPERFGGSGS